MTIYTTYGHVRGCPGIKHRTRAAAERAVDKDRRACQRERAYSDRKVAVVINGRLFHDEAGECPMWPSHGQSCGAARFRRGA